MLGIKHFWPQIWILCEISYLEPGPKVKNRESRSKNNMFDVVFYQKILVSENWCSRTPVQGYIGPLKKLYKATYFSLKSYVKVYRAP